MPRVVHFEIHADDPERCVKFYTDVLGWQIQKWDGPMEYYMCLTGDVGSPGINGGIVRRRGMIEGSSVIAYVCTVDVDDVDAYVKRAVDAGGSLALEKMPIPGVGWLAYCKDTEGNIFGMMQADQNVRM